MKKILLIVALVSVVIAIYIFGIDNKNTKKSNDIVVTGLGNSVIINTGEVVISGAANGFPGGN